MEILNIFYNNNFMAYYLIGAILVVILILIIISSMNTKPKDFENDNKILEDPMENKTLKEVIEQSNKEINSIKELEHNEPSKIDMMVEELYQQKINEEPILEETIDLNPQLEKQESQVQKTKEEIDETKFNFKEEQNKSEEIDNMLKRLYNLRQNENNTRKTALLNEIFDLKKQVDETLKSDEYNLLLDNNVDTKALADYYLFNEDIEFPKLK